MWFCVTVPDDDGEPEYASEPEDTPENAQEPEYGFASPTTVDIPTEPATYDVASGYLEVDTKVEEEEEDEVEEKPSKSPCVSLCVRVFGKIILVYGHRTLVKGVWKDNFVL